MGVPCCETWAHEPRSRIPSPASTSILRGSADAIRTSSQEDVGAGVREGAGQREGEGVLDALGRVRPQGQRVVVRPQGAEDGHGPLGDLHQHVEVAREGGGVRQHDPAAVDDSPPRALPTRMESASSAPPASHRPGASWRR